MVNVQNKIIVIYVGIAGIRSEDIDTYIKKLSEKITPISVEGEVIFIPVQANDTKIECINPIYIKDENLINEHLELMKELNENLRTQINIIKESKNE